MKESPIRTKDGRFRKGVSGNRSGRPLGSRNQATLAAEQLLEGEAELITRKVIDLAKEGNLQAVRLCLERLLPIRRERPIALQLEPAETAADLAAGFRAILAAVAEGRITPGEGQSLAEVLRGHSRVLELEEIERRVQELEAFKKDVAVFRREMSSASERFVHETKKEN